MNIQNWIEKDDWEQIMEYVKENSSQSKQFINVFLLNDANITVYRVEQFMKCYPWIEYNIAYLFTEYSDFFQNAIELNQFEVIKYIIQLEDPIDHMMIQYLITAGARFARLVPNDQLEQFLCADEESGDSFIEYVDENIDLSGLLYAVYVCSDVYLKSIYMNHYNKLINI